MTSSIVLGAVLLCTAFAADEDGLHPLSDGFIALLNSEQNSWTAGRNFPADTPMAHLEKLTGTLVDDLSTIPVEEHDPDLIASLPDNFDARQKWPNCPTINQIYDQGCCSSDWAIASVGAMTDRTCIYSNSTVNVQLSVQELISCSTMDAYGCDGGKAASAWRYWIDEGIVSGGQYRSSEGCMPYLIPGGKCKIDFSYVPVCKSECVYGYNITYDKDKHRGKKFYRVYGEDHIRAELFKNGPLSMDMYVYRDLLNYKRGIYSHTDSSLDILFGFKTVKVLGWGVEKKTKYWLVANTWGTTWGHKGYLKILRGKDNCGIESYVIAGEPA